MKEEKIIETLPKTLNNLMKKEKKTMPKKKRHRHKIEIIDECPYCGAQQGFCERCQMGFSRENEKAKWEED